MGLNTENQLLPLLTALWGQWLTPGLALTKPQCLCSGALMGPPWYNRNNTGNVPALVSSQIINQGPRGAIRVIYDSAPWEDLIQKPGDDFFLPSELNER